MRFFWQKEKRNNEICCQEESNTQIGQLSLLNLLKSQPDALSFSAVFAAIELISNSIATLSIAIKKITKNSKEVDTNHYLYKVFKSNLLTPFNLIKNLVKDLYIYGNAYVYIERDGSGKVQDLRYLEPSDVSIRYIKTRNELYYVAPSLIKGPIERYNMIHLFKNSKDGYTGQGFLVFAAKTLRLYGITEEQANRFFNSGCNISGVLTYAGNLSDKQKEEIRSNWVANHAGDKSGVAVLPGSMTYQQIGSNGRDAQMIESRIFNIQEIARFFNINPILLGELSKGNYSSIEQANIEFVTHTLLPIITLIEQEFTRKLILPNEKYRIDLEENELLRGDKNSEANYYKTLVDAAILTVNEVRHLLGFNPVDSGDELIKPYTDISQNKITNNDGNDKQSSDNDDTDNDSNSRNEGEKIDKKDNEK